MLRLPRLGLVCAVSSLVIFAGCSGNRHRLKVGQSADGEVVEAEGLAPNDPKDLIGTKRSSLLDAQRTAVEKAVGVFVSGRTLVEKAVAIENNILAKTDGYVKKYEVLEEGPMADLYRTKIRALVALKELEEDIKELSLNNVPDLKKPRVVIELKEEMGKEAVEDVPAGTALQRILSESGFVIVTPDRLKEADIVIRGKATAYPFQGSGLGGFVSYRARISVEAVRAGTKDVVSSVTQEASGLGGNAELAAMKSLETVGELVGRDLSMSLPEAWSKNKRLLVFVEGVKSFSDVERVRKHLQSQPGVNDLLMRLYDEQMAQFELELGNADGAQIAAGLEKSQALPMKVLASQGQSLRVQLP